MPAEDSIQVSSMSQVERMQSLFPRCPICNSAKGYEFSTSYPLVACKACKSEWVLYEHEMELKATSELGLAKDLLNKKRSFDFWRNAEIQSEPKQPVIRSIRALGQTLRSFQGKIEKLKSEKAGLQVEIEKLRTIGEDLIRTKEEETRSLEEEVAKLKKEVESLKELTGARSTDRTIAAPSQEPPVESPEKKEKRPSGCPHYFGYLAIHPNNAPIPEECLICPKVLDCAMEIDDSQ
jgi:myosin heavy subunit